MKLKRELCFPQIDHLPHHHSPTLPIFCAHTLGQTPTVQYTVNKLLKLIVHFARMSGLTDTTSTMAVDNATGMSQSANITAESRPRRNLRQTTLHDYRSVRPGLLSAPAASEDDSQVASETSDVDSDAPPPSKKRKLRSATRNESAEVEQEGVISWPKYRDLNLTDFQEMRGNP